ncbi:hypothetical protein IT570_08570 [Candidatus Sumerlaeota bacterium]|nr:hypothetical protein [Candidatus Sumerlaeota bacterium]
MKAAPGIMTIFLRWTAAALLLALSARIAPAQTIGDVLPQEVRIAFWIDDLTAAKKQAGGNQFYQWLMDDQKGVGTDSGAVGRTLSRIPFSAADPLQSVWPQLLPVVDGFATGSIESASDFLQISMKGIDETFSGPVALYATMFELTGDKKQYNYEWDTIFQAHFKEEERGKVERFVKKALEKIPDDAQKREVEYLGYTAKRIEFYYDVTDESGMSTQFSTVVEYAYVADTIIICEGRSEPLRNAIRALKENGTDAGRLAGTNGYRHGRAALGDSPSLFHAYVDIEHFAREAKDLKLEPESHLLDALGLSTGGPLMLDCAIDGEGATLRAALVSEGKSSGVFDLVSRSPKDGLENLSLVPSDAYGFGSFSVNGAELLRLQEKLFQVPKGRLNLLRATLENSKAALGVDLEQDIITQLLGEGVIYARRIDGTDRTSILIPYAGGQATRDAINSLLRKITSDDMLILDLESSDVDGIMVWDSGKVVTNNAIPISIAATPKGLLVTNDPAETRDQIRRIMRGESDNVTTSGSASSLSRIPHDDLRALAFTPARTSARDWGVIMGNAKKGTNISTADDVARAIGDTWWTLQARPRGMLFTLKIEQPKNGH